MLRAGVLSLVAAAGLFGGLATAQGNAVAGSPVFQQVDHRDNWRSDRDDRRYDRRHDRNKGRYDNRNDHRWDGRGHAPRYWNPPRNYYNYRHYDRWPYWRQSYGRGYRYWDNGHHYFVEPGRPAIELSFVLPLR